MASTKKYLDLIIDLFSELPGLSFRPMMGEYVVYYQNKVVGGLYDNRFLLKPLTSAVQILSDAGIEFSMALPYEGAKEMLVADIDNVELTCSLIRAIATELPAHGSRQKRK